MQRDSHSVLRKKILTHEIRVESSKAVKTKNAKVLPKTTDEIPNGGVYLQRVRCGKANCKCTRGETHLAYYFFSRRSGKLIKTYVRKSEVEAFAEIVNRASIERAQRQQSAQSSKELLKRLRESIREFEVTKKHYKQNYKYEQS